MSGPRPQPPHPAVDPAEWAALLASRNEAGEVEANNVAHVLRHAELSEDLLRQTETVLKQSDITIARVEADISGPIDRPAKEGRAAPQRPTTSTPRTVQKSTGPEAGDAVRMYLHEIGQVDLLTAEDERRLGKAIRDMQEARRKLDAGERVGGAERHELRSVVRAGDEALEHLVKANLRLVVSIARRYDGRELPLADLIQEGNIGLMRAAEKYDWEKGFKFSTYATWWIRQAMMRAMADQGRTIRVPSHVVELINRMTKAERDLTMELEREPTFEELSERTLIAVDRIEELKQIAAVSISLDEPISSDEDSSTWAERVFDKDDPDSPVDITQRKHLIAAISSELHNLPERDRRILDKRFGISSGEPQTLDEVAKQEGVTRERIRQIEQKTLARMRHPNNSQRLRSFLDDD
ncbi:MAG: RNA polymerase sigma factor RpoD/SigA [Actinomycetes bacterium]|jgi:RNA polymerase primary sigma factor